MQHKATLPPWCLTGLVIGACSLPLVLLATQLARGRYRAAGVIGSAGAMVKRRYARAWGVDAVYGSRDTGYAEATLLGTGGQGVDYVLNSLTGGDFVARTMDALAQCGHWSEIGKRGIQSEAEFAQRQRRRYS